MGYNLITGCHKCKTKVFHYRGDESYSMFAFYMKHLACMEESPANVETGLDENFQKEWMLEQEDGGYQNDNQLQAPLPIKDNTIEDKSGRQWYKKCAVCKEKKMFINGEGNAVCENKCYPKISGSF